MGSGDNVIQIGSEKFRLLPWADPFAADSETGPPNNYYSHARDTYSVVCNDTSSFLKAYATYAGTFEAGSFLRRLSFILSWDRAAWVRRDFNRYLNGGRMCAEGTPGYEKFMPQGDDAMPRSVAAALLGTNIFYYDSEKRTVVVGEEVSELDFESERAKRRLAAKGGFREIRPEEPTNVYMNEKGDLLVIGRNSVTWNPSNNESVFGISFISEGDGAPVKNAEVFVVRNDDVGEFPLLNGAPKIVDYIDSITGDAIPDEENPLSIKEVLAIFGYSYSGIEDVQVVGDYFYKAALNYEMVSGRWFSRSGGEPSDDIMRPLSYRAAEQYYLAVAIFFAMGRFTTAESMLSEAQHHFRKAGIEGRPGLEEIEDALNRLNQRLYARNRERSSNGGPRNGGGVIGGSGEEITSADDAAVSGGAAFSIEEDVADFEEVFAPEEEVDVWFSPFFPWGEPAFAAVGMP